jgi:hypothetical protein
MAGKGIWISWLIDCANQAVKGTPYQVIVVPGFETRGHGGFRALEGVVGHHTGTAESAQGDYPTLRVVRDGRSDLLGPLCNYGIGRSGNIYVVAAGVAWHAGASTYAGMVDLNDEFLGIEAESAGGGKWTKDQMVVYPRLVRSILDYIRRPMNRYASHRTVATPKGRKDDPRGIDDVWMQNQAASVVLGAPTPVQAAPAKTAQQKMDPEDLMSKIEYKMFSDGSFRSLTMCEAGNNSIFDRGWVTYGMAGWDPNAKASFTVTFLAGGGVIQQPVKEQMIKNNGDASVPIPSGARMVTIEGKASSPDVELAGNVIVVPR